MVNITYDSSGDLSYFDPTTGTTVIYNLGDTSWTLTSVALVWLMIPGLGFFYSGLLRRKNALSMIFTSMASIAVVSFQWFFWGYSLTFSETASPFIGDLKYIGLKGVLARPSIVSSRIPAITFCVYHLMFAAFTPAIAIGAIAERGRIGPLFAFIFLWSTLVYDPVACWTWNKNGWSSVRGGLDWAGGTPVHITSGSAALAISLHLGPRRGYGEDSLAYKPHNTTYVILGTVLLWFGWFGFNGGSALSSGLLASHACIVTNLAASVGGITWMLWDYYLGRRWSVVGFCSGAISGLITITPGAGFVGAPAAVLYGVVAGTVCNFATQLKIIMGYDDALDIFSSHAIGGICGNLLTGLFAQASIAGFGGIVIKGGWLDQNWVQLAYQAADSVSGLSYSFAMTSFILWIMHQFPALSLKASVDAEEMGIDDAEMGELAYNMERDF